MPTNNFHRRVEFGSSAWIEVNGYTDNGLELQFTAVWQNPLPSLGWTLERGIVTRSMFSASDFHSDMAKSLLDCIPQDRFINCPDVFSRERRDRLTRWADWLWDDFIDSGKYTRQVSLGSGAYVVFRSAAFGSNKITIQAYAENGRTPVGEKIIQIAPDMGLKEAKELYEAYQPHQLTDSWAKHKKIDVIKLLRTESRAAWDEFFPVKEVTEPEPVQMPYDNFDDLSDDEAYLGKSTLEKLRKAAEPTPVAKELRVYKRRYNESHWIVDTEITTYYDFIGIFEVDGDAVTLISGTITLESGATIPAKPGIELTTHGMEPGNWAGWERLV